MSQEYWVMCFDDGFPVLPIDCNEPEYDGELKDPGMLVYRTKRGCEASCRHQERLYDLGHLRAIMLSEHTERD